MSKAGNFSGVLLIALSLFVAMKNAGGDASSVSGEDASSSGLWAQPPAFYLSLTLLCSFGVTFSTALSSFYDLPKPQRVTIGVECVYQNVGIAQSMAVSKLQRESRTTNSASLADSG